MAAERNHDIRKEHSKIGAGVYLKNPGFDKNDI